MQKQPELPDFFRDLEIEQSLNELAKLGGKSDGDNFLQGMKDFTEADNSTS